MAEEFAILGARVQHSITAAELETFPAPRRCKQVIMESEEVTALCPVTGQPDWYKVKILYSPRERCLESKSLKLYLWSFREAGLFCEALADKVLEDLKSCLDPHWLQVEVTQRPRGGISIISSSYYDRKYAK